MVDKRWTNDRIAVAIGESAEASRHQIRVDWIDSETGVLKLELDGHGGLDVYIRADEHQIRVSSVLEAVSNVPDETAFNRRLLETQHLLPLSNFGISTVDGNAVYELQGEMSVESSFDNILEEIITLADNAIEAATMVAEWKSQG